MYPNLPISNLININFYSLKKQIKFYKLNENHPHTDLCILGKVDHAILNCVSTFSAFVKRQRDSEQKTSEFWSFTSKEHEEL